MAKKYQILLGLLLLVIIMVGGSLFYVDQNTCQPTAKALKETKNAQETNEWLYFAGEQEKPAIIFYPGALVEPASYAIWCNELAEAGYPVYLLKLPLNLAVLSPNKAKQVLAEIGEREYVIGGHSLGGVMASRFAHQQVKQNDEQLQGTFFLASYPDEKGRLTKTPLSVLSMKGSQDQVINQTAYQQAKADLPSSTSYIEIIGGNHAGFGSYGQQKGDGTATIPNEKQQRLVAENLHTWLEKLE
ncbi:MAG: alpha/beta hydrolase [Enterococcus sp.]